MTAKNIDRAAVMLDDGEAGAHRTTWGEFVDANKDAIDGGDIDIDEVIAGLLKRPGCTYFGGGGAAAKWSIRLVVDNAPMTFEQWRATRKDFDVLPEDEAGVYAGQPGSVYEAGFILATGDMSQGIAFTVALPQNEYGFSTMAEAEEFLWREWCGPEINGVDLSGGEA